MVLKKLNKLNSAGNWEGNFEELKRSEKDLRMIENKQESYSSVCLTVIFTLR